jgi:hypothetical protein
LSGPADKDANTRAKAARTKDASSNNAVKEANSKFPSEEIKSDTPTRSERPTADEADEAPAAKPAEQKDRTTDQPDKNPTESTETTAETDKNAAVDEGKDKAKPDDPPEVETKRTEKPDDDSVATNDSPPIEDTKNINGKPKDLVSDDNATSDPEERDTQAREERDNASDVETREGRVVTTIRTPDPARDGDEKKTKLSRRATDRINGGPRESHDETDETFEWFHAGPGMKPIVDSEAKADRPPGWSEEDDHIITPENGKEFTQAEIQKMLDEESIDSIAPSKTTRHAVVENPDGAQDLEVVGVSVKNGKLYVDLKDKVREGNVRPLEEWTDGREWPGADREQGAEKPTLLAREIRVVYGGEVTEAQWNEIKEKFGHLPNPLQHANLGRIVHARIDYRDGDAISGDHRVEVILPPGDIKNTTKTRRMDAYRPGEISDTKPATAGSFLGVVTQLLEYDFRTFMGKDTKGIENDLTVVVYGKTVTRTKR